ncbi:MAG TPA: hydroxymethylglutaryl-CoA lyase, partial [Vicinamibacteria bacterium]|nr:hydroxymethylglutaryl-CoA lyase [Vicinamibacteria bacterium]
MTLPPRVRVVEVGPRDGLQNEAATLGLEDKVAFAQALIDAGLP